MKMNDSLEELFSGYRPDLGDNAEYMKQIRKKLEAADELRTICVKRKKRSRRAVIITFLSGLLAGCAVSVMFILKPLIIPHTPYNLHATAFQIAACNPQLTGVLIFAVALVACITITTSRATE